MVQGNDPNLRRIFDRQGAMFDQSREILAELRGDLPGAVPVANLVYKLFEDPDNADTPDMNVDASGADRTFRVTVPPGERWAVARINFAQADNAKEIPNGFFSVGELGAGNGCLIRALNTDDSVLIDFLDGGEIRWASQFNLLAGIDTVTDTTANQTRGSVRWTIMRAGALGILEAGQSIEITLRADLSGFELFQAMAQGFRL